MSFPIIQGAAMSNLFFDVIGLAGHTTPVFHRWHHTSLEQGGNINFAGTFPLWDILFGTFRMPEGKLPEVYGVDGEQAVPTEIGGQLAYPFRH
jgi:sterol desaturase/sphingolipid hydroxylase (fatty acid hydroxylase superfamily)